MIKKENMKEFLETENITAEYIYYTDKIYNTK